MYIYVYVFVLAPFCRFVFGYITETRGLTLAGGAAVLAPPRPGGIPRPAVPAPRAPGKDSNLRNTFILLHNSYESLLK